MKCKWCGCRLLLEFEREREICVDCICKKEDAENLNELNRYREMFPIPPWDDSPITAEVCERLGLAHDAEWAARWSLDGTTVSVWCFADGRSQVNDADGDDLATTTAGQLACLVAARRNNEKH